MSKSKTTIICFLIVMLSMIIAFFIGFPSKKIKEKQETINLPVVDVMPIKLFTFQQKFSTQGRIKSRQNTLLSSDLSGKILWISDLFNEGKALKKGFIIAKIDKTSYESNLAQAQSNLAQAELNFAEENARAEQAKEDWQNLQSYDENESTNLKADDLLLRKPQLKQAKAQVLAAQAAVSKAKQDLANTQIRMPFNGVIDTRYISSGQFVNAGSQIASILGQQKEIRLPLTNKQRPYVEKKSNVDLHFNTITERAIISHVDANIDSQTQITYATAKLPLDSNMPIGAFVSASIEGKVYDKALKIPNKAVHYHQNEKPIFYTINKANKTLIENTFQLIIKENEQWIINMENIIIDGNHLIVTTSLPTMTVGMEVSTTEDNASDE